MYRVLMPIDTDEDRALAQAEYVSSLPHVADSVEAIVLFVFHGEGTDLPDELQGFNTATRIGSVRTATEYLKERNIETTVLEESGDTTTDIIAAAEDHEVDAIVLGGRKRSPAGKVIFGSITQSVILNTNRPVVVTGSKHE